MSSGRSRNSKSKNQGGAPASKKRKTELVQAAAVVDVAVAEPVALEADWDGKTGITEEAPDTVENPPPVFKDPNYVGALKETSGSKRTRKNLKQIIAAERSMSWGPDDVTYGSIEAPPSFRPYKRYSDLSGLQAKYVDPQTKLRFANPDEFNRARSLPQDIVAGLLALRKANLPVP